MEIFLGICAIIAVFFGIVFPIILFIFWLGIVHPSIIEFFSARGNNPVYFDSRKEIIPKYWLFTVGVILTWSFLGLLGDDMNIQVHINNILVDPNNIPHPKMIIGVMLALAIIFSILAFVLDLVIDNFGMIVKRLSLALVVSVITGPLSGVVANELGLTAETTGMVVSGVTFVIVLFISTD